ncbi:nucleotidyltransferase family protein [Adlercreutzia sp. ZJ141]|uniref:nucleotidyltransferase family protein n=1 Tax=Adlercreutzia sp. ZJ141 TaxID=2709406 RepID=UPI0013EA38AE|nr:nucleotidyltransferase domain-containing protein [Adlercreutzia sp. ZJ141]
MLTRDDITTAVAQVAPKYGVRRAHLFGSYARGDACAESDVDLVIELEKPLGFALGGLYLDLEKQLGCDVDIICGADRLYPFVREAFERDKVSVYG